ncbi:transposase [Pseudomonas lactucae]|nr:transposase [Pseudomonas lactucae]
MQPTRRSYSKSFKAKVIQECAQPGASIASIALSHDLNTVSVCPTHLANV